MWHRPAAMKRAVLLSLICAPTLLGCRTDTEPPGGASASKAQAPAISTEVGDEVLANMDDSISPCADFYQFACGGWIESTPLPDDQPRYGRFHVLRERNLDALHVILEEASAETNATGDLATLGQVYASCMDEEAIESRGIAPLSTVLEHISSIRDRESLMRGLGQLHRTGVSGLVSVYAGADYGNPDVNVAHVSQGGLGLPDRDYYLKDGEASEALRAAYIEHLTRVFTLLEDPNPSKRAGQVFGFEKKLAEASMPRDQLRDPTVRHNPMTREQLGKLTPNLPWDAYFEGTKHPRIADLNVAPTSYFEGLDAAVKSTKMDVLRAYLRWNAVRSFSGHLPEAFVQAHFDFYDKTLRGQAALSPRWKRCAEYTDGALPEMLGRVYVDRHFSGDSRGVALDMIQQIEAAFAEGLGDLAWMDEATQQRAVEKMEAIVNKIGYPDEWRDYGSLVLGHEHFENVVAAREFEYDRQARQVGQPVDKKEWHMSAPTVNAYYNPPNNEMVFPAGILQPPFFHPDFPMAMNFGGIGMVMGHELTHGFDDSGRKFDGSGRLTEWWEESAVERFEEQAACVEGLYDGYEVQPGVNLNGKLTLGENIADFGGIKQAHRAYTHWAEGQGIDARGPALEGLNREQLFFVSFAQLWCTKATPEVERVMAMTDPHSHPKYRVNGPLSNLPAFHEAFSCEPGQAMRPQNSCEVW
jgi:predicted metalloendopeptidase